MTKPGRVNMGVDEWRNRFEFFDSQPLANVAWWVVENEDLLKRFCEDKRVEFDEFMKGKLRKMGDEL